MHRKPGVRGAVLIWRSNKDVPRYNQLEQFRQNRSGGMESGDRFHTYVSIHCFTFKKQTFYRLGSHSR